MALKALILRKKLDEKRKALEALRAKDADFVSREAELEAAVSEAVSEDEVRTVEEAVTEFTEQREAHEEEVANLEREISDIETELDEEERTAPIVIKAVEPEERKDEINMETRKFFNMTPAEAKSFIEREDVKDFLARVRTLGEQKRDIAGKDLLIPTVVLELIRENVLRYSKLYRHVNVRRVNGKARQVVMGTVPEAVWTEMCANLNELNLAFTNVEVDGYKVGGYIAVCNAVLEDSDINLASEIISALGQAIGLALDKAILYGTGTKMPMGIVTRLVQSADPGAAPAGSRPWENLSESNVISIANSETDAKLFKALIPATGKAKGVYSRGEKFWVMNEATYTALIANAMTINAAGAVAAGVDGTMPIIGGVIEVLPFVQDNVIIGGYGDLYLLAERADARMSQSEHAMFIEDQTVFKGTARYDGMPVIPEGFVAIGISGATPNATMSFATDVAN